MSYLVNHYKYLVLLDQGMNKIIDELVGLPFGIDSLSTFLLLYHVLGRCLPPRENGADGARASCVFTMATRELFMAM